MSRVRYFPSFYVDYTLLSAIELLLLQSLILCEYNNIIIMTYLNCLLLNSAECARWIYMWQFQVENEHYSVFN